MRTQILICVLAVAMGSSCSGNESVRPEIKQPPPADYSGTFQVSFSRVANTCRTDVVPPASTVRITVIGDRMLFGNVPGQWDANALRGYCYDSYCSYTGQNCMICSDISYTIAFSGYYSFVGARNVRYLYDEGCGISNCYVNYTMIGTRVR